MLLKTFQILLRICVILNNYIMENKTNITTGDNLIIAGVQYEVKHIETCKDCCLNNSRICGLLDPSISCGEKTHLGFKTVGFNQLKFDQLWLNIKNRNKHKSNNSQILKQV